MKTKRFALIICLLTFIFGLQGLPTVLLAEESTFRCDIGFEATIHHGPSAETTLLGDLAFDLDAAGSLTGQFLVDDGTQIPVAGQVVGRSISMIFDLGDERYIYGVGVSLRDVRSDDCGGEMGGPFVGPADGDSGDWRKGKPGKGVLNLETNPDQPEDGLIEPTDQPGQ